MAIVIATRIQDDFSSNALTSFALARPAGRFSGLRTDDPIFRTDLSPPLPTHAKEARSVYRCVLGRGVFEVTQAHFPTMVLLVRV